MDDKYFVELWNSNKSLDDIVRLLGKNKSTVQKRASRMRSRGLRLRYRYPPRAHYVSIGAEGGKKSRTGGFYANRELARMAGAKGGRIGGRISRRRPKVQ